jgi:hypothetical protein
VIAANLEIGASTRPSVVQDYEKRLRARIEQCSPTRRHGRSGGRDPRDRGVRREDRHRRGDHPAAGPPRAVLDRIIGNDGSPLGRTLEFLTQEMLREANTMASKSPTPRSAGRIVEIKGAIDRIKEQVLNVA